MNRLLLCALAGATLLPCPVFAGILLGLAVDYGVVHYQEALASPNAIVPEIRRAIGPSIFWAAVTTISAVLVLNLGGMPGLAAGVSGRGPDRRQHPGPDRGPRTARE